MFLKAKDSTALPLKPFSWNRFFLGIKKIFKTIFVGNTRPRQMFNLYLYFLLFGTILLMTPLATVKGQWNFLEALFTASSAFSDTGLTVKSTANDFTFFGQLVVLLLIKFGGIGLIAVKLFLLSLFQFGHNSNLKERLLIQGERGSPKLGTSVNVLKVGIIVMTLTEFLGAITLALYFYFVPNSGVSYGTNADMIYNNNFWLSLWAGVFHSISAVNNAGFDIIGQNSLVPFQTDYFVQWVFIIEFVIGGIGFPVFYDLFSYIRSKTEGKRFRFSLFTKLTVSTYFIVAILGVGSVVLVELVSPIDSQSIWGNMSNGNALMAIFFNTMSTRNAGFYTIELTRFHATSGVIQSFMMWIGSSPASTAGGIRTTTLAIIIMSIFSLASGRENVNIFKRKIAPQTIKMAFAVAFVGGFMVIFTSMVILIENLFNNINGDIGFVQSLYDAASAFGTTGLSVFDNARLGVVSKICLIICMFVGQLGVSTTILAWSDSKRKRNINRIQEDVQIG
ncbi:TrkH family potassium uptake protein [Spiroplasma platyhelix]|uniref:TrkH family potassium uptake protein n=1 Tax=Spiroplasma platyhelix PALS-1 TaxID=1276218 RepID=A0A846U139_9MOLU|nr:potassium transporter TrkG [Spiroplasma platyhelix]MBE4703846.1 Ktr system potassium uptake protein B [Spiroplasma platyhelix PALS-1]NKE38219.1 TrkH family potassium uptake protein [Spiroplasma platyhelix PALS-1]UJB29104.1 potassium uptake protein KtrB [Spiroplasma platyhelix PALS-1]